MKKFQFNHILTLPANNPNLIEWLAVMPYSIRIKNYDDVTRGAAFRIAGDLTYGSPTGHPNYHISVALSQINPHLQLPLFEEHIKELYREEERGRLCLSIPANPYECISHIITSYSQDKREQFARYKPCREEAIMLMQSYDGPRIYNLREVQE